MLAYVTIGYTDEAPAQGFYDAVLGAVGMKRAFSDGGWTGYVAEGAADANVFLVPPFDGQPARGGNGIMIAFKGSSVENVKAAYAAGLAHGGADEGAPGARPDDSTTFYGAYLRDPAGNKIAIYCRP